MNSWRPYPLVRLVLPFAAGIIAEVYAGSAGALRLWLPAVMAVLILISQILTVKAGNYRLRWITGLLFNLFLMIAGYGIACCHRPANDPGFLGKHPDGLFIATVSEPPAITSTGIKAVLKVGFRREQGGWVRTCGNVMGYLKMRPGEALLQYGDHVLVKGGFAEISDNSNPHSFNYSAYLENKGITHRVFADSWSWRPIGLKPGGLIRKIAFQVRDRLLNILRDNHVEGKEFAVAAALLLGYVDDLDADLRKDYAATGAMHILSVSGMHVGIIYIFLEFLLGFLNKSKPGRFLKAVLLLVFIWFYAMLTGLSPCVLRSAAMLSLPILGKSLNRSPNMYNIIAASLVFILAMDPFLILDVGFQLSYLAVTGIIILYKPIYDLYVTSAWLPDKIWSILAVSVAAQLATLPITLYTFHQFPNYFMLTNIFVVPLSSLIIYVGIVALVTGYLPVVSVLCAKALIFLVWSLNSVIHLIEELPGSTIRGIFISAPVMLLLYLLIGSVFLFLTLRRITFLYLCITTAILVELLFLDAKIDRLESARMTVFNSTREALYMFSFQDKAVLLYHAMARNGRISLNPNHDMAIAEMNANGIRFHRDYWLNTARRREEIAKSFVPVFVSGNFISFSGCRVAIAGSPVPKGFNHSVKVDLLVISGSPKIKLAEAIRIFHPAQIVIDATNSRYKTMQWVKDAVSLGVKCHAVTEHGAWQKEF